MNRSKEQKNTAIQRCLAYFIALVMIFSISLPAMTASAGVLPSAEADYTIADGIIIGYTGEDTELVIPEVIAGQPVTAIGSEAFRNKGLTSVTLPDTVTEIMASAFRDNALTSMEFNEALTKIGNHAFRSNALTSLDFAVGLTEIGQQAFTDNELTTVSFPASLETIGTGAFLLNRLTAIDLNEGLVSIGANAFTNQPIVSLIIPDSVRSIGMRAFSSTGVTDGGALTSLQLGEGLEVIGRYAFEKNRLTSLVIPDSVTIIDDAAFWKNQITEVELGEGLERIGFQAFTENALGAVTIPRGVVTLEFNAFTVNPEVNLEFEAMQVILSEADAIDRSLYTAESGQVLDAAVQAAEAVHGEAVPVLSAINAAIAAIRAALDDLVHVPLDGSWGTEHFSYDGTRLTGFSALGELKFSVDKAIVIPSKTPDDTDLLTIGASAFNRSAFGEDGIQALTLPATLTGIEALAFRNNNIEELNLPERLTTLGNGAFANNQDLARLTLPGSLKAIPGGAFSFAGLIELVIPEGVTSIGASAFSDNSALASLSLPDTLSEIGSRAFWGSALTELAIPGSVTSIGSYAFNRSSLTDLTLAEGIVSIASQAFANNVLTGVTIPESVTTLHASAFNGNPDIDLSFAGLDRLLDEAAAIETWRYTPETVQALEEAVATGEARQAEKLPLLVDVQAAGAAIQAALEGLIEKSLDGPWTTEHFTYDGTTLTGFSALGELKFAEDKELVIPEKTPEGQNLLAIGASAFNRDAFGTDGIQTLTLPGTLTSIGLMAFRNNNIIELVLPDSLTDLGNGAFANNQDLATLTLSKGLTAIPQGAFSFSKITELLIPDGVTSIGGSAFSDNRLLAVLTLPDTLREIGSRAFWGSALTELTIPGSVENIRSDAFINGTIHTLILEEGVANIAARAFKNNDLGRVIIPKSVVSLHASAFDGNANIDVRYASLNEILAEAAAIDRSLYTEESLQVLDDAVTAAETLHEEAFPLLADANSAVEAIQEAISNLAVISLEGPWTTDHFGYDGTTLTGFSALGELKFAEDKELVIPEKTPDGLSLLTIGDRAFNRDTYGTEGIQTLVLPETLESIEIMAFRNNNIVEVVLPDSLTTLGNGVFAANHDLAKLTLSNSLTVIPQGAFSFNRITELVIPEGVTAIGGSAFSDNKQLTDLTLPNTLVDIGSRAFWGSALTELTLPGSVQYIRSDAFINGTIHTLILEEGVANIAARAFKNNDLGRVIIPKSVVSLHASAFDGNANIDVRYAALTEILAEAAAVDTYWKTEESIQVLTNAVTTAEALHEEAFPGLAAIQQAVQTIRAAIDGLEDQALTLLEMEPAEDLTVKAGDVVTLSFRSASGADAWYSITLPLTAPAMENAARAALTETEPGRYEATWTVPEDLVIRGALVLFGVSKDGAAAEATASGTITVEAVTEPAPLPEVTRIAGSNRIRTAIEASRRAFSEADTVILASGYDFPDALAGAPLAEALHAPILLTGQAEVSPLVMDEIQRLGASRVILLGGEMALSAEMETQLADYTVTRMAGSNRFQTAALIAEEVLEVSGQRTVILTNGLDFPDALSVGPAAAKDGSPVLFTRQDQLSTTTLAALEALGIENVTIIGGEVAVGESVAAALEEAGYSVERVSGRNRYATAVEVARAKFTAPDTVVIASGEDFPDALAAGPLAAGLNAPLLLVQKDRVSQDVLDYLAEHSIRKVLILGGTAVIDDSVVEIIEAVVDPSAETLAMSRVTLKAA